MILVLRGLLTNENERKTRSPQEACFSSFEIWAPFPSGEDNFVNFTHLKRENFEEVLNLEFHLGFTPLFLKINNKGQFFSTLLNETWRRVKLPQNPSLSCKFCILFSRSCHSRFSHTKFITLRVNFRLFETNYQLKTVTMARRFHHLRLRLLTSILVTEEVREMADSARRRLKQPQQSKM